jgi:general secretion pathway protein A
MYQEFYGLHTKPFEITPDPRFLYASEQHKEAFAVLLYGLRARKGLMVLTGDVGTGKTLLTRYLLKVVDSEVETAYIFNPRLKPGDFLDTIASEFGLNEKIRTKGRFLLELNWFLLKKAYDHKGVLLVVDEAQNLSFQVLEEIRMLMNLETANAKLLQVILAGQPELNRLLNSDRLKPFKQRISLRFHLKPLNRQQTLEYVGKRLQVAGSNGSSLFTARALRKVYDYSAGVPRLINVVCDNALLTGYALGDKQIGFSLVKEVIADLEGSKTSGGVKRALDGLLGMKSRRGEKS